MNHKKGLLRGLWIPLKKPESLTRHRHGPKPESLPIGSIVVPSFGGTL